MKLIRLLICIGTLILLFYSCSETNSITGCLEDNNSTIVRIEKDGLIFRDNKSGTWKLIDNDRLVIEWDDGTSNTHTIVKNNSDLIIIRYNGLIEFTWKKTECNLIKGKNNINSQKNKKEIIEIGVIDVVF